MDKQPPSRGWKIAFGAAAALILVAAAVFLVMFALGGMTRITAWYTFQFVLPIVGAVGLVVVLISVLARRRVDRPAALLGLLAVAALLPAVLLVRPITYPANVATTTPSATVRLPSDAPLLVAWGGDKASGNAHAVTPDQRWAYDLVVEPYFHARTELTDYGCYGALVVAPADGVVAAAHDGEPDAVPGVVSNNFTAPAGNYVAILLPTDTYLLIAHLKPGSVLVSEGDTVTEGQPIGQCGNSGNTSEPHIHLHHQRQNPQEYPINFAEGLPLYFRDHVDQDGNPGAAMPSGGVRIEGETVEPLGPTLRHVGP